MSTTSQIYTLANENMKDEKYPKISLYGRQISLCSDHVSSIRTIKSKNQVLTKTSLRKTGLTFGVLFSL
ncbi:hypothetical protein MTR_6g068950 [Medicago truncatula]|uniref:Uncharacterized protein n=1 Tax=Medicago truncatula TaxID=3880 RepID=G7KPC7_MEDTR|nr:hypothetical protein MTR_6g068950 [Medicago truncatula]